MNFGQDMSKWFISKLRSPDGLWHVCPPMTGDPKWWENGGTFPTYPEALAAFAQGKQEQA